MRRSIVVALTLVASIMFVPTQVMAASGCGEEPDFDGDGRADLAIGVPAETGATEHPGGVHVLYGSGSGLSASGDQLLYQGAGGLAGVASDGDLFGFALATGDFDADGFTDLAVGVPGEFVVEGNAGAVQIIYGSASGLTGDGDQIFHQNTSGITDSSEFEDRFGSALASCDFDGDGRDDLAIGVPGEEVVGASNDHGAVHVLYGTSAGLSASGDQLIHQDTSGITDFAEGADEFGRTLAAGDFDGDGRDDLAVGIPLESLDIADEGAVHVIYGSSTGLSASGDQLWHQDVSGVADNAEPTEQFGFAVAVGDFDGDGRDDLAVGVPRQDIVGTGTQEGAVHVLYGSAAGLTASGDQLLHEDVSGMAGTAEEGEQFGFALAAGNFDGDGRDDLAVGIPFQDVFDTILVQFDAGAVHVIYGSSTGLTASGDQLIDITASGAEPSGVDYLGSAVGAGDFNNDGRSDLAAGIQGRDIPESGNDQGAALVVYGSADGLTSDDGQLWHQDVSGVTDAAATETNQYFGGSLPGSPFINLD